MARARTLTLKTQVEVKGLDKLDNLGKKLQATGKTLTVGVTLPLVAAGVAAFKFGSDMEEASSKAATVFGDAIGKIDREAGNLNDILDEATFRDMAGTFGALLKNMGFTADAAADLSVDWLKLSQDMASFHNVDPTEALNAIRASLSGEFEPLKRFGVSLNVATVEAKALEQGLWDGTGALDAQTRALIVNQELFAQQPDLLGDMERTMGGAANQTRNLMQNFKDMAGTLGQELLPLGTDLLKMANGWVKGFKDMNPETRQWVVRIAAAAAALGPVLFIAGKFLSSIKLLVAGVSALRFAFLHIPTVMGFVDLAFAKTAAASRVLLASLGPLGLIAALGAAALAIDHFVDDALSPLSDGMRDLANATGEDVIKVEKVIGGLADSLDVEFSTAERRVREYMERTGADFDEAAKAVERGVTAMTDAQRQAVVDAGNAWADHQNVLSDALYGSGGMVATVTAGADAMADEMGEAPGKMADELLAAQFHLTDATTELVNFMEQALSPAQEKFNLQGFLASKELALALEQGTPLVQQKAQEMKDAAEARLAELDGYSAGYKFGVSLARGMDAAAGVWVQSVRDAGVAVRNIFPDSEPKDPRSPFRGITHAWGFMPALAQGIKSTAGIANRALAGAFATPQLSPATAGGSRSQASALPMRGGDIHIHLNVDGDLTSDRERGVVDLIGRALFVAGFNDRTLVR
jgi:hypothetical protein